MNSLQGAIRKLRQERGWTQLELANRLGVTPVTVYNWERGKYEPKVAQLRAMTKLFGICMICLGQSNVAQNIAQVVQELGERL
jgi:DNA-binding XRE family transcriptional regulator